MFKFIKQKENMLLGLSGIIVVIILWQTVAAYKLIDPILLSSPIDVFNESISLFKTGEIYPDLIASISEFLIGFLLALFLGFIFGFILGWFKKTRAVFNPLLFGLYATPIIAILPLIILWFGFGLFAKVSIVFLSSFFPILISIMESAKNTDQNLLKLARSFKASEFNIITAIIIPNSIPGIVSGIKIAMPRGIIGMIIAEFFTGNAGLGYLISYYGSTFQTAKLLAIVILIAGASVVFTAVIDLLEKKVKYNN